MEQPPIFRQWEQTILNTVNPEMDYTQGKTHGWFLMSFYEAALTCIAYLIVVYVGYLYMRGHEENSVLRPLQYIYNPIQVALCGWLVFETVKTSKALDYKLVCNNFEPNDSDTRMHQLLYIFYLSKALDFLDTLFIVFHKKDKQLSFLHLYHHVTIFLTYWVNANVFYSGDIYYTIIANGSVHTVMYFYYFVSMFKSDSGFGLVLQKLTAASRPFITGMQLTQFVTMLAQAVYILNNKCGSPLIWVGYYLMYIASLFILFMNFAIQNYCKKKESRKDKKDM